MGCAAIGFADDFIKIVKRRSLGLSARWKMLFQLFLALALWWVARHEVGLEPILFFRIGTSFGYEADPGRVPWKISTIDEIPPSILHR